MINRADIKSDLADARRARGLAALHGKAVDHARIDALEHQLAALDDAEVVQTSLERSDAEQQHQATIVAKRQELADVRAVKAKVWSSAESKVREGFADLKLYVAHAATERRLVVELNALAGENARIEAVSPMVERISRYIAAQIKLLTGKAVAEGYGILKFRLSTVLPPADKSWKE